MKKVNNKNTYFKKLETKYNKKKLNYKQYLLDELNYEPEIVEPRYKRIIIYTKDGHESYNCPKFLPKSDFLFRNSNEKMKKYGED